MPRWEPDARERLVAAALDLFLERGYDDVTVAEIAARAGVTRSTFFRHFPDKRDLLAAGQEALSRLMSDGIAGAPASATALEAVEAGLVNAASAMTEVNRELGSKIHAAVAVNDELRERAILKQVGLTAAMASALEARGVAATTAALAAELGGLAFHHAFEAWTGGSTKSLPALCRAELKKLRKAAAALG